jgi:heme/copper-type cytochrome/quinol oxidase subunit 1
MTSWGWLLVPPVAGAAALIAALVLQLSTPVGVGWFAYAPLSDTMFVPSPIAASAKVALLVVGCVLIGGWGGFLLGRRSRRS